MQSESKRSWPGSNPAIPSSHLLRIWVVPQGTDGQGKTWGGSSWPYPDAGTCRLVVRPRPARHTCDQSLHTQWHTLGLHLFFPLLGLQPTYLALESLAAFRQIGRTSQMGTGSTVPAGGKKHVSSGDFLTIYQIGELFIFLISPQRVHLWAPLRLQTGKLADTWQWR